MNQEQMIKDFCVALKIDKEKDILIFDPYVIQTEDLLEAGIKNLVRIRRPHWGRGNISEYVKMIGYEEFKNSLINGGKMKLPWKKKVKIRMDDLMLENFIKDILCCPKTWTSRSMFHSLTIDIDVKHPKRLRRRIFNWLSERCRYES